MCLGSPLEGQHRGLPKTPESTIEEGGFPLHFIVFRYHSRKSRGGVASVEASPWGLPHLREPVWRPCYQGVPRVAMGVPGDTMGVPGVAMDDPGVAMGVPVG